jgi:hypothetical protein
MRESDFAFGYFIFTKRKKSILKTRQFNAKSACEIGRLIWDLSANVDF